MKEFLTLVFGNISIATYLACFFFALLGVAVSTYGEVSGRNVRSADTPILFSWTFLALDNLKRYAITLILIFLQFRFSNESLGIDLNPYAALLMGISADGIAGIAKRYFSVLKADREKIYNNNPYTSIPK